MSEVDKKKAAVLILSVLLSRKIHEFVDEQLDSKEWKALELPDKTRHDLIAEIVSGMTIHAFNYLKEYCHTSS